MKEKILELLLRIIVDLDNMDRLLTSVAFNKKLSGVIEALTISTDLQEELENFFKNLQLEDSQDSTLAQLREKWVSLNGEIEG